MSQLPQILRYLDRDDITEIVIQTGRALTVRLGGEYRPLSKNPVSSQQIEALCVGTPLEAMLPSEDSGGSGQTLKLGERTYQVRVAKRGPALQVRIEATWAKPGSGPRGDSQVGPLPRGDSQVGPLPRGDSQVGPLPREDSRVGPLPDRPSGLPGDRPSGLPGDRPSGLLADRPSGVLSDRSSALPSDRSSTVPVDRLSKLPSNPGVPAPASRGTGPTPAPPSPVAPSHERPSQQGFDRTSEPKLKASSGLPPSPVAAPAAPAFRGDAHRAVTRPVDVESLVQGAAEGMGNLTAPRMPQISPRDLGRGAPAGPFAVLVQEARARRASDLHIVASQPVRARTAGDLVAMGEALDAPAVERLLMPLLNGEQKAQLAQRGYVDFALELEGAGRLRANVSRQRTGLKGSFRLVMSPTPTLDDLGLPKELARVTSYHQGLVVIAGPNGHGKTTTLAAIVDLINSSKPHHILTVEEPVEFLHNRKKAVISQREVGLHTNSFATALKASLREDPDVIVIGELRDRETVEIALTAAETGHLVMVTMSTPSAGKTIDRLIDFFPPEDQNQVRSSLAGALKFIVAQRLLPSVSGDSFVAAVELLTGVPPLWALIRENKLYQLPSLQQRGRAFGMIRFDDSLAELVRAGKISEEVALRYADNKKELANALHPASGAAAPAAPAPNPAAAAAAAAAAKGIQDIKSRVGGLFGKKE